MKDSFVQAYLILLFGARGAQMVPGREKRRCRTVWTQIIRYEKSLFLQTF